MTQQEIALVQSTFAHIRPIADKAAEIFYGRLFALAPGIATLFKTDIHDQGRKLMATLGTVVASLHDMTPILPVASALAKRHVAYGVGQSDYVVVGEALLWALEKGLGAAWTPEAARAWARAYAKLSAFMIGEAYGTA